ncbi:MAG: fumarate hydratase C-terminal domain-containing protein [Oscillospiraceae bacterium]
MQRSINLQPSCFRSICDKLRIGDKVLLTRTVYTACDAAHKRFDALLNECKPLPFEIKDAVIYYSGSTPAAPGKAIGSCGPTTSGRMDKFAPRLLDCGLRAMIGKGERSNYVKSVVERNNAVFLCYRRCRYISRKLYKKCEVIAFEDLDCESVK